MLVRALVLIAIGTSCLLFAEDEAGQSIRIPKTERMDFPARGLLHLKHSIGDLKVEGWDEPVMEVTTTKAPRLRYDSHGNERAYLRHELEEVRVTAERQGNEIIITTNFPRRRSFPPPSPFRGSAGVALGYQIKVPRDARLIIEHEEGEVHVEDLTGDVRVTTIRGEIALRLPDCQHAIDAKSDLGSIISDFPGRERRRPWLFGHRFVADESSSAGPKLYLRAGFGDIIIQKIQRPTASATAHQ
jgi:hypothetical protein